MNHDTPAYGLGLLVILNSASFIMFAYSFFKPATTRDWRTLGAVSAFVVALFVEVYGFPLTTYLLSGWLQTQYPSLDLLSHNTGHLWSTLLGEKGNPHFGGLHMASYILLAIGFVLLPTLLTLIMFPIWLAMYARLAITEEHAMRAQFGDAFERYVERTPRHIRRLRRQSAVH